jgi:hypothetical protein
MESSDPPSLQQLTTIMSKENDVLFETLNSMKTNAKLAINTLEKNLKQSTIIKNNNNNNNLQSSSNNNILKKR